MAVHHPFKEGDRGIEIGKLQRLLRLHGYQEIAIDEFFGVTTKQAVIDFQQKYDLDAEGIVNADTWFALRETLVHSAVVDPELYPGVRKPLAVMQLQWLLRRHRYSNITVDGHFDAITEAAVVDFQTRHNLEATGRVNSQTWVALRGRLQQTS